MHCLVYDDHRTGSRDDRVKILLGSTTTTTTFKQTNMSADHPDNVVVDQDQL